MGDVIISLAYLVASVLFILCLRGLSSPEQGRRGILLGEIGMLLAVVATLLKREIISYEWIVAGLLLGSLIGTAISLRIPMTKMPERIALSHSFGGLATALVGVAEYHTHGVHFEHARFTMGAIGLETFLGFLTFTGSIVAFGKLQGLISGKPIMIPGRRLVTVPLAGVAQYDRQTRETTCQLAAVLYHVGRLRDAPRPAAA